MRGARGLLISIAGGPDLTLYEVDEAATRIREEVDPEANIILGATFDETLDGTMRVSVVATGLSLDADIGMLQDDGEEPSDAVSSVYGFSGSGPITPAPMAERPVPAAPIPVEVAEAEEAPSEPEMMEPSEPEMPEQMQPAASEDDGEQEPAHPVAPAAPRVHTASETPKMPEPEDFPPIAQKQMAAQTSRSSPAARQSRRNSARACWSALQVSASARSARSLRFSRRSTMSHGSSSSPRNRANGKI